MFLGNQMNALTGNQLSAMSPLGPGLQTLIARIETLTASDPTARAILAQLQQLSGVSPTAATTVERAVLLNRLLTYLSRTDPVAAKRLAPALPAFQALVLGLMRAQHNGLLAGGLMSGGYGLSILGGSALSVSTPVPASIRFASFSGLMASSPAGQSTAVQSGQASGAVMHKRSGVAIHLPAPASAPVPPAPAPLSGGGGAAAGGGGVGSAAPAIALLAALVVWALNFFSGRVDLDLAPWRTTLLASRLERPG
jgi:hypothetical protein